MSVYITAWKKTEDGKAKHYCDINDNDAFQWDVEYDGMKYRDCPKQFDNRLDAQEFANACALSFKAGRGAAFADLRLFIGVK